MQTISLTINGTEVMVRKGAWVLEAARSAGIYVPSLCHYSGLMPLPDVAPDQACQLCVVEVGGELTLSCATLANEGMKVETETSRIRELRRIKLLDIMRRHPCTCLGANGTERCEALTPGSSAVRFGERCLVCTENGSCELQRVAKYVGLEQLPSYLPKGLSARTDSPFFVRDHNYCILCERCVRVCRDIRGVDVLDFAFPCHRACPAGIDIPRYIRNIAWGRPSAALAVIREKVPFPGVLGRVCVHPCESACQRGQVVDHPLHVRMLKRFAADNGDDSWKGLSKRLSPSGKMVAVVGSGPAGLTAAYYLVKLGHRVTVFEALPQPGGMMRVGIPEYRLPRDVLGSEIDEMKNAGVEIRLNRRVESTDSLFREGYNAIFLGLGAHEGMQMGVPGEELPGVIEAAKFLRQVNLGESIDVGKRVGVVGGGNVAIDAARCSLRLGAKKVAIFYRRTRAEMPGSPEEVDAALEEGIEINYLVAPSKVTRDNGTVKLVCGRMKLGQADSSGRARPIPIEGSEFVTELDTLIPAIGQRPQVAKGLRVELQRGNLIKVDASMRTSQQGVFSGGDCVSGPASVIEAIAAGRKAAEAIDRYLGGKGDISESLVPHDQATTWLEEELPDEKLASISSLSPENRVGGFDEVEKGMPARIAAEEARRCLQCYAIAPPDEKTLEQAGCKFCGACVDACPAGALAERTVLGSGAPDREIVTICPYCGVGCQLKLQTKGGRILAVKPDLEGPANHGQACVKGKFGLDFVHSPDRLTRPLIRKNGRLAEVGWDEALSLVASRFSAYGTDQRALISSARCTNEDNYVAQKFARVALGTNNVDHCARL